MKLLSLCFITICLFYCTSSRAQSDSVFKYRSTKFQLVLKDKNGEFQASDCMSETNLIIVMNFAVKVKRIKIYTNHEQSYDILTIGKSYVDEDGDKWFKIDCINEDGLQCQIRERRLSSSEDNNNIVLYVDFSNMTYVYRMHLDKN